MPKYPNWPRYTRRDCERLLDVHQQLNRARDALEHSNWAGGRPVAGLLMSALILVSDLYNRCEEVFLHSASPMAESPPGEPVSEISAAPAEVEAEWTQVKSSEQG
jgi:hypothetical protein